jgi:hypothetical protein
MYHTTVVITYRTAFGQTCFVACKPTDVACTKRSIGNMCGTVIRVIY